MACLCEDWSVTETRLFGVIGASARMMINFYEVAREDGDMARNARK